jgi:hypothetical protein
VNLLTLIVHNRSVGSNCIEILYQRFVSFSRSNVQRSLPFTLRAEIIIAFMQILLLQLTHAGGAGKLGRSSD